MNYNTKLNEITHEVFSEMAYGSSPTATPITKDELLTKIREIVDANAPIKFTSVTDATYKKKNPLGTIYKVSMVDGQLNADYGEEKEAKMQAADPAAVYTGGKSYGQHVTGSVVEHNGKTYIQVKPISALAPKFVVRDNIGRFASKEKEEVKDYLAPKRPAGPTDVAVRRYQMDSIVAVELDGQDYKVSDVETIRKQVLDTVNF